eukprot:553938-Pyramimonas_sp.AAC.3
MIPREHAHAIPDTLLAIQSPFIILGLPPLLAHSGLICDASKTIRGGRESKACPGGQVLLDTHQPKQSPHSIESTCAGACSAACGERWILVRGYEDAPTPPAWHPVETNDTD